MAKKLNAGTVIGVVLGGFVIIVLVDHFVLKGKLGIAGRINQLIGNIKFKTGQQRSPPITAATPPEGGFGPSRGSQNPELEEQLLAEQDALAQMEPETAFIGRRRRRYYRR